MDKKLAPGEGRSEAVSFQEIIKTDTRPVPEVISRQRYDFLGDDNVPVSRYLDHGFFAREVDKMWLKVWQMACREEDIPEPGDHVVYDNVGQSLLVVRQRDGGIKAFYNSCLHRGRKLATQDGSVERFRCPYHGWTWETDGSLAHVTCAWDFPHITPENSRLPEARVGSWGGFVFVNFDDGAGSLEDYLGTLVDDFKRWPLEDRYKTVHVGKVIPANWKATAEAFMEAYHVVATHPQIMPFCADANTQYDVLDKHINRHVNAMALPSPHLPADEVSGQMIIDSFLGGSGRAGGREVKLAEGEDPRHFMAQYNREQLAAQNGHDYSQVTDAEMLDAFVYNVFPNFSPWGGELPNIVYRWRPVGLDPNKTLMEVMILEKAPKDRPRPAPAPYRYLTEDEPWTAAEELGALGGVFEQDMANIPYVQEGMRASKKGAISLGNYQESRIRHFHQVLDQYLQG